MKVHLVNPNDNRTKSIKWGVSWVYFIFGGWALLFSGKWLYIGFEWVFDIVMGATGGAAAPLVFLYHLFLFFFGNKSYARHLLSKGWEPMHDSDRQLLGV